MEEENLQENLNALETAVQSDWWLTLLVAAGIIAVTAIIAHFVAVLIKRLLAQDSNTFLPSSSIFVNIIKGVIWFTGICAVLGICFNIDISAGIAALGVGGIALSLGLQDTISNLIGGLQVSMMKIVKPGDNIQIGVNEGVVRDITWHHTTIISPSGEEVIVPNSVINKQILVHLPPSDQVIVEFVVRSDGHCLDEVASSIKQACSESLTKDFTVTKAPVVQFTEVGEFGFKGKIILKISDQSRVNVAQDEVIRAIAPLTRNVHDVGHLAKNPS